MKFSSSALLAAFALVGTTTTNALVPTKLSYLTDQEWEAAAANYAPPVKEASSAVSSFLEQASSAILQLGHRVLDDGVIEGEAFEAAAGGAVDDDEVNSGDSVSFDPPIAYSQYTSDTCDSESLTYSGTISSIKLIEEGDDNGGSVFCTTGEEEGEPVYTKLTNVACSILGVEDKFQTCSDEDCSECDDGNFLGFTTWDQVFPDPVEDHCFQQIFSADGDTFDDETNANIDFQFDTASTDAGVRYTTFIVLNSCIQTFVSSDGVVFTDDSITVTDDEGGSTTLTDDSLTLEEADGTTIVLTDDSVTLSGADDDEGLVIPDADLTATDDGGVVIANDDVEISITEEGDFVAVTDDSITYGNDDAYISFTEESAVFGSIDTGDSFTIMGGLDFTDDSVVFTPETGGSLEFKEETVIVEGVDAEGAQQFTTITDPVYDYTTDDTGAGFFTIAGSIPDCDDFFIGFNAESGYAGSEDCAFFAAVGEEGGMIATDDSVTVGNEDAYISFTEESATFGSSDTGDSFTVMGSVEFNDEQDDENVVFTPETGGSIKFLEDTVYVQGVDLDTGDATSTKITDPVYDYTTDDTGAGFFTIAGSIEGCDDFILGFNAESGYTGSEDCGFFAAVGEEGGMLLTDDSVTVGNEDVYIVFMEDSAEFGSTVTGSSFTVMDLVIEFTEDDEGVIVTNSGGGTMTFTADTVTLTSVNEGDKDLVISDPVFSYMEEKGFFTIQGPTDDCDDFGLAFDAEGLVMGSIDCEFSFFGGDITPEDMDDAMMAMDDAMMAMDDEMMAMDDEMMAMDDEMMGDDTDDDAIVSASGDDSDSSCETIEQLLCSGALSAKFTVLCSLLQATPIPALTLTVFAPTDTAFGNLLALLGVASAAEVDPETLTMILMFHVAPGQHLLDELECGQLLPMIGSGSSRTKCNTPKREAGVTDFIMQKGGGNRKNDIEPTIIFPDIMACDDSVIHIISEVMLPNDIDKIKKRK